MLYVVVRENEAERLERAVTADRAEAEACYLEAYRACENGPDNGLGEDPDIVSRCWLYSTETSDPAEAETMTTDGRATLMESFSSAYPG